MIDRPLFTSKHFDIWFNTCEIGVGINYAWTIHTLFIRLLFFEFAISRNNELS